MLLKVSSFLLSLSFLIRKFWLFRLSHMRVHEPERFPASSILSMHVLDQQVEFV